LRRTYLDGCHGKDGEGEFLVEWVLAQFYGFFEWVTIDFSSEIEASLLFECDEEGLKRSIF